MATKKAKEKFERDYSVVSKDFCKGIIEIAEKYITLSKEFTAVKRQIKAKIDELAVKYPDEYKKYVEDLKGTRKVVKLEKEDCIEELEWLKTRTSASYFLSDVNIAKSNYQLFRNSLNNTKEKFAKVTDVEDDLKKVVDEYHSICLNSNQVNNTKMHLTLAIEKTEKLVKKNGYALEPKTEEEYEQIMLDNRTRMRDR